MSKIRLYGATSGYIDLAAPDVSPDAIIKLPDSDIATESFVSSATSGLASESYVDAAIPIYAHGRVLANGTVVYLTGMSVSRTGTGVYVYTFSTTHPTGNYSVFANPANSPGTDPNMFVHSFSTAGFTLTVASGDNSGTADVPADFNHSILVIGA